MFYDEENKCPVCGAPAERSHEEFPYWFVTCPACGRFKILRYPVGQDEHRPDDADKLASYLYYNGKINKPLSDYRFFNFVGPKEAFDQTHSEYPWCFYVTKDIVNNWYPKTFSEKVDLFLLGLASRASFMSEVITFSKEEFESACFVIRKADGSTKPVSERVADQINYFIGYLVKQEYIEATSCRCIILPKGLERIDSLQRDIKNTTKNVFVSMSFSEGTKETREALRNAIIDAGFSPKFIDEIIHNKQIVPEMFRLIRECRFLILEISDPNYGAYYEAGYALGLGKEVIICCSKEAFNRKYETEEEQKYAKYLRPHFDIAQKQILVWDDYADLRKKLSEWIKALFG